MPIYYVELRRFTVISLVGPMPVRGVREWNDGSCWTTGPVKIPSDRVRPWGVGCVEVPENCGFFKSSVGPKSPILK